MYADKIGREQLLFVKPVIPASRPSCEEPQFVDRRESGRVRDI